MRVFERLQYVLAFGVCRLTTSALSVTSMKVCSKLQQLFYRGSVTLLKAHKKTKFHLFMYRFHQTFLLNQEQHPLSFFYPSSWN